MVRRASSRTGVERLWEVSQWWWGGFKMEAAGQTARRCLQEAWEPGLPTTHALRVGVMWLVVLGQVVLGLLWLWL